MRTFALAIFCAATAGAQDLSGVWRDPQGRFAEVTHDGRTIELRAGNGNLFKGTVTGTAIAMTYTMTTAEEVPYSLPAQVKAQLVGSTITLTGTIGANPESLALTIGAEMITYNPQTFRITARAPSSASVTYTRSHTRIQLVAFDEVPRSRGGRVVSMIQAGDTFDLRFEVQRRWEGTPGKLRIRYSTSRLGPFERLLDPQGWGPGDVSITYVGKDTMKFNETGQDRTILGFMGMRVFDGDTVKISYGPDTLKIRVWEHVGAEIRSMEEAHTANIRDTVITVARGPLGAPQTGMFRVSAVPREMGDANRVGNMNARVYSDSDPTGLQVTLQETSVSSDVFWSPQALSISNARPTSGTTLFARPGDRIFVKTGDIVDDVVWYTSNGNNRYGAAVSPAWRVPTSKAQYDAMRSLFPSPVAIPFLTADRSINCILSTDCLRANTWPTFDRFLKNPAYLTAEEVIVAKWPRIVAAAAAEAVPADLVAAIMLQNMRSMNSDDIGWDGGTWVGKSIGISQTPYYIVQRVVAARGIPSIGLAKGTVLTDDRAIQLLFDADTSVSIAAAHIAHVAQVAKSLPGGTAVWFDLTVFKAPAAVTDRERDGAAMIGYTVDQWQMVGDAPVAGPGRGNGDYQDAIVIALEDVRRFMRAGNVLAPGLDSTQRVYIEAVSLGVVLINQRAQTYLNGFKAGDLAPNHFPRDRQRSKRIPLDAVYSRP